MDSSLRNYRPPNDLLRDRVILVTGSGQGLGRAAAIAFARHGAAVILHGRNVKKLEPLYDEIVDAGWRQPAILPLDLEAATSADYEKMAEAIATEFGRLDGILHSAAHLTRLTPLESQTLEEWMALLKVNLAAPFALTRACLALLKAAQDASVIMTAESHGREPRAFWGGFAVAKAGLEALVKIWAQEWEIHPQLRINSLVPGPVRSPQRQRTHPAETRATLPTPEQLMPVYLFFMGPQSRGCSGQVASC